MTHLKDKGEDKMPTIQNMSIKLGDELECVGVPTYANFTLGKVYKVVSDGGWLGLICNQGTFHSETVSEFEPVEESGDETVTKITTGKYIVVIRDSVLKDIIVKTMNSGESVSIVKIIKGADSVYDTEQGKFIKEGTIGEEEANKILELSRE
jgi:hypothetical protein